MKFFKFLTVFTVSVSTAFSAFGLESIGKVTALRGTVYAQEPTGGKALLKVNAPVYQNQLIVTAQKSKVQLVLNDESVFTVGEDTELLLDKYVYDPLTNEGTSVVESTKGIFKFLTGKIAKKDPSKVKLNTPFATIGVRGSGGVVQVDAFGQTTLNMTECCLNIAPRDGSSAPVELQQVNTFSRIEKAGAAASAPQTASFDMMLSMEKAVSLETQVEEVSNAQKDLPNKAKKEEGEPVQENAVKEKNKEDRVSSRLNKLLQARNEQLQAASDAVREVDNERRRDARRERPAPTDTTPTDPAPGPAEPAPVEPAPAEIVVKTFTEGLKRHKDSDGVVLSGVTTSRIVKEGDTNFLRIELSDGSVLKAPALDADGVEDKNITLDGNPIANAKVLRGAGNAFYVVNYDDTNGKNEVVVGERINETQLKNMDKISFLKLKADALSGSAPLVKPNENMADIVVDSTGGRNAVVGGSVNLKEKEFTSILGKLKGDGLDAKVFHKKGDTVKNAQAKSAEIYGDASRLDAVRLNVTGGVSQSPLAISAFNSAVAKAKEDVIRAERGAYTPGTQTLEGFVAGHLKEGASYKRISNKQYVDEVTMARKDDGNAFASNTTYIKGFRLNSGGGKSAGDYVQAKFATEPGTPAVQVGHNIWGAEMDKMINSGSLVDGKGAILSSAFVDLSDFSGITQDCKSCKYLTWGVWGGEFDPMGSNASVELVPFVVGEITRHFQANIQNENAGSHEYTGVMVGSVSDGSSVKNEAGNFSVMVDFSDRSVKNFGANFAGYILRQDGDVTVDATGRAMIDNLRLDVFKDDNDVGSGSANGALFGPNAENIGGNFDFTSTTENAAGIFAGKK